MDNTVHPFVYHHAIANSHLPAGAPWLYASSNCHYNYSNASAPVCHIKYWLLSRVSIWFPILFSSVLFWMNHMWNLVLLETVRKFHCKFSGNTVPCTTDIHEFWKSGPLHHFLARNLLENTACLPKKSYMK
jgi:hypothetical protein